MSHELDLYGSDINWRKAISIFAVMSVIVGVVGFFGYRWLTNVTPVSRDQALQMFQDESRVEDEARAAEPGDKGSRSGTARDENKTPARGTNDSSDKDGHSSGSGGDGSSPKNDKSAVAAGTGSTERPAATRTSRRHEDPATPKEGVYSWTTKGWEEAAGIRRDFPSESQRIITASDGDSFKQHHYFSEEREIWSEFVISNKGAHMASQRNRAKFGPVANDSTITFSPPMLVGLASPEVGTTWSGKWRGKTSGSYTSRIFDHGRMTIGGKSVEVWGYELRLEMRGELEGSVFARIMYAPRHALTVQEHYTQDIQSERGRYRAEWSMTLKSTTPQT